MRGTGGRSTSAPLECTVLDLLRQVMTESHPDAKEIVVERAKPMREAESNGTYDDFVAMVNAG